MATSDPSAGSGAGNPPVPAVAELSVTEDRGAVLLTVALRLTADDMLDLLLRSLGTVGRIKKVQAMISDEQLRAEFLELIEQRNRGEVDPPDPLIEHSLAGRRAEGRRRLFLLCGQLWNDPIYGRCARQLRAWHRDCWHHTAYPITPEEQQALPYQDDDAAERH
jgi:hypothetical protein